MESNKDFDATIEWTTQLAEEFAPKELDLVPFVLQDFVAGGKVRKKQLRRAKGGILGGFGGGGQTFLPWILQALSVCTPFFAGLLANRTIENLQIIRREIENIVEARQQKTRPPAKLYSDDPMVKECINSLAKVLRQMGLSSERSETLAYRLIFFLLKDPRNAIVFMEKITEHP